MKWCFATINDTGGPRKCFSYNSKMASFGYDIIYDVVSEDEKQSREAENYFLPTLNALTCSVDVGIMAFICYGLHMLCYVIV